MKNNLHNLKTEHLTQLSEYRTKIIKHPPLRNLFLELTLRCNENCIHCGSRCNEVRSDELSTSDYKRILDQIKHDFDISKIQLDITGGEPLLRDDFFEIMDYANKLGYRWGMTSNAILIDDAVADKLQKCGMKTIAVSLDGMAETHDRLRGRKGAFDAAVKGINALINNGKFQHIQITTVINHQNITDLIPMFNWLEDVDVDSWRVINIEPMGRAKDHPELMLSNEEYKYIFDFIKEKRRDGYPITYGCSHFLGLDYECEVRDWYFLCNAGLYTASIMANGDIGACLDIERRPELIQGNVLRDNFKNVWENKFKFFRKDLDNLNPTCSECPEKKFCHGGAFHSWDYDKNAPIMCFKNILFN